MQPKKDGPEDAPPALVAAVRRSVPAAGLLILSGLTAGCVADSFYVTEGNPEVLAGKDSAGAVIEIEKWLSGPSHARVRDVVLGTGETEFAWDDDQLSFTITFPAGVAISYTADLLAAGRPALVTTIEGTWVQHAGGLFGQDTGTWEVQRESTPGS